MKPDFLIGCNGRGAQASSIDKPISLEEASIDEQFRLVKETGVFDYFDRIPLRSNIDEYRAAIEKYDLPVASASWFYRLGEDEALIEENLKIAHEIGAEMHNIMIFTEHADGHVVTNQEIVDCYLDTYDKAMKIGIEPAFELHVNMWSEDFRKVTPVARAVQDKGVPFNYTLDYSHVNFKIENPEEQDISGIREGGPADPRSVRGRQSVRRVAGTGHRALASGALGRAQWAEKHLVQIRAWAKCRRHAGDGRGRGTGGRPRHHVSLHQARTGRMALTLVCLQSRADQRGGAQGAQISQGGSAKAAQIRHHRNDQPAGLRP
jgi:hypothetical protein